MYRGSLINENKWRAIQGGVNSSLIDFGKQEQVPFVNLFDEMMEFIDDVVDYNEKIKLSQLLKIINYF